jgi:hypothetical protein
VESDGLIGRNVNRPNGLSFGVFLAKPIFRLAIAYGPVKPKPKAGSEILGLTPATFHNVDILAGSPLRCACRLVEAWGQLGTQVFKRAVWINRRVVPLRIRNIVHVDSKPLARLGLIAGRRDSTRAPVSFTFGEPAVRKKGVQALSRLTTDYSLVLLALQRD